MNDLIRRGIVLLIVAALAGVAGCGSRLTASTTDGSGTNGLTAVSAPTESPSTTRLGSNVGASTSRATSASGQQSSDGTSTPKSSGSTSAAQTTIPPVPPPAYPGTYEYQQSGTSSAGGASHAVPSQGDVVIDVPVRQADNSSVQTWHTYSSSSSAPDDTTFIFSPKAILLSSEVIRVSSGGSTYTYTCTFSPPVAIIPWPPTTGYQFSGSGSCGSFTASISGSIPSTQQTSIDDRSVTAFVLDTNIYTSGGVDSTIQSTDWVDPESSLDVYESASTKGTYGGLFSFSSQVTRRLVSERPQ
jgi:hypothetical protein